MQYKGWEDPDTGFLYSGLSIWNASLPQILVEKVVAGSKK